VSGIVSFYNRFKGWGFCVPDDNSEDVFVHHSNLIGRRFLREDERIEFELSKRNGRPCALNVRIIESAETEPSHNGGVR
jgi:cold shock protein